VPPICKMHHRGNECSELIENLGRRCYLPVEMSAAYFQVETIDPGLVVGIHPHRNTLLMKREPRAAELEVLLVAQELQEVRNEKCKLVEERDLELLEDRGMYLRKKCIQVSSFGSERKPVKVKKRDVRHDRCVRQMPFNATFSKRKVKGDPKNLHLRHAGKLE